MRLGIDLGTTFSAGAYVNAAGEPEIIINKEGGRLMPSVVFFEGDNRVIVGETAKENSILYPDRVISTVKNYMGKKIEFPISNGKSYTPEEISAFILRKLVNDASEYIGQEIEGVVITIPAYFTDAQRKATEDAAKIAGLHLLAMINEPTAAAIYYAHKLHLSGKGNVMVYDLGGGTFDVTVLHMDQGDIVVKSTHGLANVGGKFFDQDIVDYVCDYFMEKYGIDLEGEEYLEEYQELFLKAENCKIQLSSKNCASIVLKVGRIKENITITREFFEEKVKKFYSRSEISVKKAMRDAGLTFDDLDKIILVGSSSKIPYIAQQLQILTGKQPSKEVNPDEAVALGAALYANMLGGGQASIIDVCSHSIGIVVIDNLQNKQKVNHILISHNSPLPCEIEQTFYTMVNNQKAIELSVTEGEFKELSDVTILFTSVIDLPEGLPARTEVKIKLALDKNQLLHVYLEIPAVHLSKEYTIKRDANMDDEELNRLMGLIADYEIN